MKHFNILTDSLPETVKIFDTQYRVHTSYRNWISIIKLLSDETSDDAKKIAEALSLCYKDTLPPNIVSSYLGLLTFLNRGTDFSVSRAGGEEPLFSFEADADVIYAAFYAKYGIDLTKTDLHWYAFCALFRSLSEENSFQTLIKIRSFDEKGIKDPKKRRKMAALKETFSLQKKSGVEIDVADKLSGLF